MISGMDFRNLPTLTPNKPKLLAAMLLLIEEACKAQLKLTADEIVKALFVADDRHLARYGRPITFDNYVAMKDGPVGDLAYDMLNGTWNIRWSEFDLDRAPWTKEHIDGRTYFRPGTIAANRGKLSPSDVDELTSALGHVTSVGFGAISAETHSHPAWLAAWSAKDVSDRAAAMDWRDFPVIDGDLIKDLAFASRNAASASI